MIEARTIWHEHACADGSEAVIVRPAAVYGTHVLTAMECSLHSDAACAKVWLFGLRALWFDGSNPAILDMAELRFNLAGHRLPEGHPVVYDNGGGMSIEGLASGHVYHVFDADEAGFSLETVRGGGAVDLAGAQSAFGKDQRLYPLCRAWYLTDALALTWGSGLQAAADSAIYLRCKMLSGKAYLNLSGYTR